MADTQFVGDKPLTFDCDLDLGHWNLNLCATHLLFLLYLSVKFDLIPFIGFLILLYLSVKFD